MTRLHHIALGAGDVEKVAAFYREIFDLVEITRHQDDGGHLRSIWLDLDGAILMVERTSYELPEPIPGVGTGPFLLAFEISEAERSTMEARLKEAGHPIEDRTGFTSYARDPEGNGVAISFYKPQC